MEGLPRLAKRAARAVECEEGNGDVFVPRGLSVCDVWVGCWVCCTGWAVSGAAVEVGTDGRVEVEAVVAGISVVSGSSNSASSSCHELSVGCPVDIEPIILSLGVGIISERMSSSSVLASSSSSSSATY